MEIKDFKVEQWMNLWETKCTYNVAETCVYSLSLDQLFELCGGDKNAFLNSFSTRRMTYGDIEGRPDLLEGITKLYRTVEPEHVIPTHGAAGANELVLTTLVNPGDHVVSVMPTYQQLYSIPEMCGAKVDITLKRRTATTWTSTRWTSSSPRTRSSSASTIPTTPRAPFLTGTP